MSLGEPKERLSHLLDVRDRRLAEPVDLPYCMKAVCYQLLEPLGGVDLETTWYHRNCYLNFTSKLDRLKGSTSATSDQPSLSSFLHGRTSMEVYWAHGWSSRKKQSALQTQGWRSLCKRGWIPWDLSQQLQPQVLQPYPENGEALCRAVTNGEWKLPKHIIWKSRFICLCMLSGSGVMQKGFSPLAWTSIQNSCQVNLMGH